MKAYSDNINGIKLFVGFAILAIKDCHIVNCATIGKKDVNMLRAHRCFRKFR